MASAATAYWMTPIVRKSAAPPWRFCTSVPAVMPSTPMKQASKPALWT